MDEPLYHRDPLADSARTRVLRSGDDEGRPWVVLADDLFYPEGGGQPSDRGTVGGVGVVHVTRVEGETRVYLEARGVEGECDAVLDRDRRFDHMQQHTGQHLLSALAEDRFGWPTTAFHLGEEYSAIEVPCPPPAPRDLERLEGAVNAEIREARPVRPRLVSPEEMGALPVRTRGLPEGHQGPVRLVEIDGVDLNTCGGTHCRSTAWLQALRLLGAEPMRGGSRLRFLVGGRVLRAAREAARLEGSLKAALGCGPGEFVRIVEGRAEEARRLRRRAETAESELARATGESLARDPRGRAVHASRGRGPDFLRALAAAFEAVRPDGAAVFLAEDGEAAYLLVHAGEGCGLEAGEVGGTLAALLGGRGGGRGERFQGKGPDPSRLDRAERKARALLGLES